MRLTFEQVEHLYDPDTGTPVQALRGISLSIGEGSFIGLIGHTGSGKTTLVQHAVGLQRPTKGRILADGEDIWGDRYDRRKLRAGVGLVFQYPEHQLFETDILADVSYGPRNLGLSETEIEERATEALAQVGIGSDLYTASPFELSGGQKRRVAIAGVLAMKPGILILDEPTAGLDPRGRQGILSLVEKLHRESGITIVLVSHSMEDVAQYADRLLVMNDGALMYDDTPAAVFAREEELAAIGLAVPQTRKLLGMLKDRGLTGLDTAAVTPRAAAEAIARALAAKEGSV